MFTKLSHLTRGDRVAIISPCSGLPQIFPWVLEKGLERMREKFGLVPVEYPCTRRMGSSFEDRVADIHAAFQDPAIKAVFSSIGGFDGIRVVPFLKREIISANPKAFFGYSDATHLCNFLWSCGIPCFYGGSVMKQWAAEGGMHPYTERYLTHALFKGGEITILPSNEFTEEEVGWEEPANLDRRAPFQPAPPWNWNGSGISEGRLWGGCLDSIRYQLLINRWLPSKEDLKGAVLFFETSECMPAAFEVEEILVALGERGYLSNASGLLMGRAKAWFILGKQPSPEERTRYRDEQQATVQRVFREFNKTAPLLQGLDFGHTDPQVPIPMGNLARIDATNRTLSLTF